MKIKASVKATRLFHRDASGPAWHHSAPNSTYLLAKRATFVHIFDSANSCQTEVIYHNGSSVSYTSSTSAVSLAPALSLCVCIPLSPHYPRNLILDPLSLHLHLHPFPTTSKTLFYISIQKSYIDASPKTSAATSACSTSSLSSSGQPATYESRVFKSQHHEA